MPYTFVPIYVRRDRCFWSMGCSSSAYQRRTCIQQTMGSYLYLSYCMSNPHWTDQEYGHFLLYKCSTTIYCNPGPSCTDPLWLCDKLYWCSQWDGVSFKGRKSEINRVIRRFPTIKWVFNPRRRLTWEVSGNEWLAFAGVFWTQCLWIWNQLDWPTKSYQRSWPK